ncbi:hypothetical protein L7F22_042085 [Adiantum nelumboides]|nr:hypothetical protein [Adiantum nelumboides]
MSASASGSYHSQFAKTEEDGNRHEERVFSQNGGSAGMTQAPPSLAGSDNVHGMGIAGLPTMDQSTFGSLPPNWADSIPVDMQAQWLQLQQQQQQHHQQIQQMQRQQQQQQSQYNISQGFSHPQNEAGSSTSRHTNSSYNNPQDSPEVFVGGQHPFSSPSQSSPFQDASYQHMFQSPSQQQQRTQSPHHSQHSFMGTQNQQAHHPFPPSAQQHLSRNSNDSPLVQDASADLAFLQAATGMQHLPYSTQNISWQQQQQQQQQQFQPSSRNGSITNGNQAHPIMTPDFTDRALSAALASNAQISSNRNITGSGVNVSPMASSNTSSFPQSAGNTTPTILEEDEAIFHAHHHAIGQNDQRFFNAPDHLLTSQSFNQPEQFTGQHPSHMPMPSTLMQPRRAGPNLLRASIYQQYSNINVGMMEERFRDSKEDCLPFIDDVIFNYISAPSRLGLGERTVMIMTSKVAQKSYGAEKRFLCPPPMVLLVGSSWWSACHPVNTTNDEVQPTILTPPRLAISMSGETPNQAGNAGGSSSQQDGVLEWASSSGKLLDTDNPSSEFAISGRSIGRQLFINDSDEKRRHCEALVQIQVPALAASDRKSLGVFPSKPIKVISKPSKKRQSTRNSELGVNHGSTISLFHRLRSQTVSTRYLCVSGAPTWFKGSDGNPFLNTDANTHIPNQGDSPSCFVAKTSSWDPFILYLVDPHMQAGANPTSNSTHNPSVEQKFTPSTAFMQSGIPGDGNDSTVVSPVMVIRKADRGTTVVGGGQPMMSFGSNGPPPGEMYGEPVSQLHKVAFEILEEQPDGGESIQSGNPGISGHFLGCLNEDVGLRKPLGPRQWMQTSSASTTVNQSGMHINPLLRDTGVVGNMSNPTTPTTPLTPMTTQMFGSAGNHSGMNAGNISGEFKMDPSISPTGFMTYGSGNSGSQQMMGSSSQHGMGGSNIPPTTYPYNMNPQMMPTATTDDQADDGKVKRPRRVSSSVLVPQKSGGSSAAVSNANKNRRRGQSLSVIGLQNQLNAQQQQQQQRNQMQVSSQQTPPHHMTHSMHQQRPSFTASTTNTSSSSSSISSMTGIPSGHSLRRTSSFAQSDTSSLSAAAMNSAASNPNTTTNHWTVDVHDSDVWTIVGVDIARHTFYLPPKLVNGTRPKADGVDASIAHLVTMPAPAHPITPIPILHKCSGGASGLSTSLSNSSLALAASHKSGNGMYQAEANLTGTPDSPLRPASASSSGGGGGGGGRGTASGYVTLIGENFTPNLFIFFGDWRSTHVSVPNSNTIICAAPPPLDEFGFARDHVPIILVRRDGVIFPTDCIWYKTTT